MNATLSRRTHTSLFQDAVEMVWKEPKIPLSLYRVDSIGFPVMGVTVTLLSRLVSPVRGHITNKYINLI